MEIVYAIRSVCYFFSTQYMAQKAIKKTGGEVHHSLTQVLIQDVYG
jgi:hypothetical protein